MSDVHPTGTCMVLVSDKERCVCTNLGACIDVDEKFLKEQWAEVEECRAVYCTGFLMSSSSAVSPDVKRCENCLLLVPGTRAANLHLGKMNNQHTSFPILFCFNWRQVVLELAKHCQQSGKLFACNLSAEFLMHEFKSEYIDMLRMANVACGNKEEATKYAEINELDTSGSIGDVGAQILELMLKGLDDGKNKTKMVVITQGSDPVIVASRR